MENWLKRICAELALVSAADISSHAPTDRVGPRDNFAGILSEEEKAGYVLIERRRKRAEDILKAHMVSCSDSNCNCLKNDEFEGIRAEINELTAMSWASIHENRPTLVGKELAVRHGWTLVWVSPNPCSTTQQLVDELRMEVGQT